MCVEYSERVTGGARVREVHVYETHGLERREARARSGRAVVGALQGSRDSFLFLLFGLCVNDCGKAPVGDKLELFKCCRVFAFIRIYSVLAWSLVAVMDCFDSCVIKCAGLMFPLHVVFFLLIETPS